MKFDTDPVTDTAITVAARHAMFRSSANSRNWLTIMNSAAAHLSDAVDLPIEEQRWWDVLYEYFEEFKEQIIDDYGGDMPQKLREGLSDHDRGFIKLVSLPISTLGLPTRIENALARAGIQRIYSLIALQQVPDRLLGVSDFGEKSLEVVNETLDRYRLKREQVMDRAKSKVCSEGYPSSREQEYLDELSELITPQTPRQTPT